MFDTSCMVKSGIVTVGGYAMGFVMALFMNAMEFREIDTARGFKVSTKKALQVLLT